MTTRILSWPGLAGERAQAEPIDPAQATTGGGGAGVGPVCIGIVAGPLRAELVRSYLDQAGIGVYLQGAAVAGAYGLVGGPLGEVRVFVSAAQAEEAARIFAEIDFSV
jgi:putative signal transducing protein